MLLAIDVGNSNITLGLYDLETPGPRWRLATVHNRTADEYGLLLDDLLEHAGFDTDAVDAVVMASVVPPLTSVLVEAATRYLGRAPPSGRACAMPKGCAPCSPKRLPGNRSRGRTTSRSPTP